MKNVNSNVMDPSPEFHTFVEVCEKSPLFQQKIKEFKLPPGFEVIIEVSISKSAFFAKAHEKVYHSQQCTC